MKKEIDHVTVEVERGDIAAQKDIEAVVNAANAQLKTGGGVAGALHRGAGPQLEKACRPWAPIAPGEAVLTPGFNLPNAYVVHCLGPVYGQDEPSDKLLADCYRNALRAAEKEGIESIAFPSISTGAFGYPMEEAARIAFDTILEEIPNLENLRKIRFVIYGEEAFEIHKKTLEGLKK